MADLEHHEEGGRMVIGKRKTLVEEQQARIEQLEADNAVLRTESSNNTVTLLDLFEMINTPA